MNRGSTGNGTAGGRTSGRIVLAATVCAALAGALCWGIVDVEATPTSTNAHASSAETPSRQRLAQAPAQKLDVETEPRPADRSESKSEAALATQDELKGKSLFDRQPLQPPAPPPASDAAKQRAELGANAKALNPRLERRLTTMRAQLATATPEQRRALQIDIEAMERNLEIRQKRETAAGSASRRATP